MSFGDTHRAHLRTLVDTIEHELDRSTDSASTPLRQMWSELVTALALGPAPALRSCPVCKQMGMRTASRCGNCWAALAPLTTES